MAGDRAVRKIQARQAAIWPARTGGDSVFTLYLTLDLRPVLLRPDRQRALFLHAVHCRALQRRHERAVPTLPQAGSRVLTADRARIIAWLERFVELNTYEISCPVLRDDTLAPAGKTGLDRQPAVRLCARTGTSRTLGWYEEFQRAVRRRMVAVLDGTIYPGLKAAVIDRFTSTPLTIERITGNADGAITGWAFTNDPSPRSASLSKVASSVLTPIPDIYQAGQWTFSPSGLPISILTGKLAADRVLKDLERSRVKLPGLHATRSRLMSQTRFPSVRSRAWAAGFSSMVRWKNRPLTPAISGAAAR